MRKVLGDNHDRALYQKTNDSRLVEGSAVNKLGMVRLRTFLGLSLALALSSGLGASRLAFLDDQVVHVDRLNVLGESVGVDAGLALSSLLRGALDAAALEALVDTEDDVVGDVSLEVKDFLYTEATESSTNDVRGKAEEALGDLLDTGVLAVEAYAVRISTSSP